MSDSVTQADASHLRISKLRLRPQKLQPLNQQTPKRVAAGKAVAERTRLAREAHKKVASEAAVIIGNNKTKETPVVL